MKRKIIQASALIAATLFFAGCKTATSLIDSRVYVPEEGGISFVKVTDETKEQITPNIVKEMGRLTWWANPFMSFNKEGKSMAYLRNSNDKSNIFVRQLTGESSAQQRTFTGGVNDVAYSPDGKTLCFTRDNNGYCAIFTTSATEGSVIQQVSSPNVRDYGPHYSTDGKLIFFARNDGGNYTIWSYDTEKGTVSNYCYGLSPYPINNEEFLCVRRNSQNNYEIWRVNYVKGKESIIMSQEGRSFTTPSLSPDGRWILCASNTNNAGTENIDIYVIRADGSQLTQLTYHPGNDLSPVWSPDGKSIYFLSQRGTEKGEYNIWKMDFKL